MKFGDTKAIDRECQQCWAKPGLFCTIDLWGVYTNRRGSLLNNIGSHESRRKDAGKHESPPRKAKEEAKREVTTTIGFW